MKSRHIKKNLMVRFGLIAMISVLLLAGCGGRYAHLESSRGVADQFHSNTVLPDHRYYYTGPDAAPTAILGVHRSYTLESRIWKSVELDEDRLNDWIGWLNSFRLPSRSGAYGYAIIDDAGKQIGVWYSRHRHVAVELFDDGRITVSLPRDTDVEFYLGVRVN